MTHKPRVIERHLSVDTVLARLNTNALHVVATRARALARTDKNTAVFWQTLDAIATERARQTNTPKDKQ